MTSTTSGGAQTEAAAPDRRSPLDAEHDALGAAMTSFGGWRMPLRYTSDLAEHRAVREAAGLFDLSHMGEIVVNGPEAGAALDYALVGKPSSIGFTPGERPSGRARYTMICAEDGGVLDDLIVYRMSETMFLVVANAGNAPRVFSELVARCSGFDADVTDQTAPIALIAVQGPQAEEIVAGLIADPDEAAAVRAMKYYAWAMASMELPDVTVDATVARTGYTGEDGFELFVPSDVAVTVWRALLAAGEPVGLVPAGLSARDSLRLEAGMPLYGHELSADRTPYDAGLGRVVKLDKADAAGRPLPFVGRQALARRSEEEPAQVLVGLRGMGRRPARAGYDVVDGTGRVIGQVTSGLPSPTLGYPIAMAYVTADAAEPGTELAVDVRGRREPVVIAQLPFYRRTSR